MPHSSGGGSFSGGVHSGSYSSGGLHHTEPTPTLSRRPTIGATHYVLYGLHGRYRDYYCTGGRLKRPNLVVTAVIGTVITLIAVVFLWILWHAAFFTPVRADTTAYNPTLVVEDHMNVMDSEEKLDAAMASFLDTTGVATGVEIVADSEWKPYCDDLETFAYNEYLRLYDDDMHWLVVISYPDDPVARSTGWSWEGMIGDNISATIGDKTQDNMTVLVEQALLRNAPEQIGDGLADAFTTLESTAMDFAFSFSNLLLYLFVLALYIFLMYGYVYQEIVKARVLDKGVKVDTGAQMLNCPSCGCAYYVGTASYCPQCGAELPR